MRYLGIDYGKKRVGVAMSDGQGQFAMPVGVFETDKAMGAIKNICQKEGIGEIVIGESKDFDGKENPIMKDIKNFANLLADTTGLTVSFEPEFLTSAEAERIQGQTKSLDASAAALILKSFLERKMS